MAQRSTLDAGCYTRRMFGGLSAQDIIFLFASLLVGITIHEMMHGYAAYWLGDTTAAEAGRLSLNPLRSVDPLTTILLPLLLIVTLGVPFFAAKPVPFNPARLKWDEFGAALVGLAGPATNFVLALIGAALFHASQGSTASIFFLYFVEVNVGIMIFNLIPLPPLDGSRVLYAFAPEPVQRVMENIERAGLLVVIVFILVLLPVISPALSTAITSVTHFLLG